METTISTKNSNENPKVDWLNPPATIHAVLCYISKGDEYLLLLKSKGRFGEGFWNAPGGKVEPGETSEQAAAREVLEETGLKVMELIAAGSVEFYFGKGKERPDWSVQVFHCSKFLESEKPSLSSDEGELRWFHKDALPYDNMWADDRYWLPHLIEGKKFEGVFVFSEDSKELLKASVTLL